MGIDSFAPNPRGVYIGRVRVVLSRIPGGFAAERALVVFLRLAVA